MASDHQMVILLEERLKTTDPARRAAADALMTAIESELPRSGWECRAVSAVQAYPEAIRHVGDLCQLLDPPISV